MRARDWVNKYADENDLELLVMDEFDEAIIGICHRFTETFVLYDRAKVIEILAADMAADCEEGDDAETMAWEHFDFNIIGGWVGEHTPAFVEYPPKDQAEEGRRPTGGSRRPGAGKKGVKPAPE